MLLQAVKYGVSSLSARAGLLRSKQSGGIKLDKSQIGASGIEYAVIAGLIVVALVAAVATLDLDTIFTNLSTEISEVIPTEE